MMECKPSATLIEINLHKPKDHMNEYEDLDPTYYRQIIESLMCLVNIYPNILYATHTLSQFMCIPKKIHFQAAKYIMSYLKGTIGMGIKYEKVNLELTRYSDFDWARSYIECKNTLGYYFTLGSEMISWTVGNKLLWP